MSDTSGRQARRRADDLRQQMLHVGEFAADVRAACRGRGAYGAERPNCRTAELPDDLRTRAEELAAAADARVTRLRDEWRTATMAEGREPYDG